MSYYLVCKASCPDPQPDIVAVEVTQTYLAELLESVRKVRELKTVWPWIYQVQQWARPLEWGHGGGIHDWLAGAHDLLTGELADARVDGGEPVLLRADPNIWEGRIVPVECELESYLGDGVAWECLVRHTGVTVTSSRVSFEMLEAVKAYLAVHQP